MDIDELIQRVERLDVRLELQRSFVNTSNAIERLQKLQMLYGLKSDSGRIGRYRNKYYAVKKYRQNSLAGLGFVDLRLDGFFYDDVYVDIDDRSITILSDNDKTPDLIGKYGEKIFGLNEQYASEYSLNHLMPNHIERIKNKIHGGL